MTSESIFKKSLVALSLVTLVALVGVVGAQATSNANSQNNNYSKDQCKDGGWKNFHNPDGSQTFKNQGDCVSFFATDGKNPPSGSSGH